MGLPAGQLFLHRGCGLLMIPKTCAYVWTVLIGYSAMKAEYTKAD